jgi:hypothetical protein
MAYLSFSHDVTRLNHLNNQVMRETAEYEGVKLIDTYCCQSHHVTLTICCEIIFSGIATYALYRSNIFKFLVVLFDSFRWVRKLIFLAMNSQSRHCKCHVLLLLRLSDPLSTKP